MKKLLSIFLILLMTSPLYAKDFAKRYPTDTAMEVFTPNSPPATGNVLGLDITKYVPYTGATGSVTLGTWNISAATGTLTEIKLPTNGVGADYIYATNNSTDTGIPSEDGFKVRWKNTGIGLGANNDALIIEKTDANDANPDGAIQFVNTGSDGTQTVAMDIYGSGGIEAYEYLTCKNFSESSHYTGFPNRTDTDISWDDGTYTLTLTATDDKIWIDGVEYNINTLTKQLTVPQEATSGVYWFWLTESAGVVSLNASTTEPGFDQCLVATVYWNTTTSKGILGDERHCFGRDQWMHEYLHETVGARYYRGGVGTFTDTTLSVTALEFYDEDIEHICSDDTPMSYPGTAMTTCRVLYHNGDADWAWDTLTTPYKVVNPGVDNTLRYNNGTALATASNNKYINYWMFASSDVAEPIHVVIGTAEYNTLALARAATIPSLGALPSPEYKIIYKITYKNSGGSPVYQETTDYRATSGLPIVNFVVTDHGSLGGLTDDDHPQYLVDTATGTRSATYYTSGNISANGQLQATGGILTTKLVNTGTSTSAVVSVNATGGAYYLPTYFGASGQVITLQADGSTIWGAGGGGGGGPEVDTLATVTARGATTTDTLGLWDFTFQSATGATLNLSADLTGSGKVGIGPLGVSAFSHRLFLSDENGLNSDAGFWVAGGSYATFDFRSSQGTLAAPTISMNGDYLGAIWGSGYALADWSADVGAVTFMVDGDAGDLYVPTKIAFSTVEVGGNVYNTYMNSNGNWDFSTGSIVTLGTIAAGADTDSISSLGRAKIGNNGIGDFATFSHYDHNSNTNFGFGQYSDGGSYMNAPTGKLLHFNINGVDMATMSSTEFNAGSLNLTTTGDITCNTLNYTTLNPPVSGGSSSGSIIFTFAGSNGAIATNTVAWAVIPQNCVLKEWSLTSYSTSPYLKVDVLKGNYLGFDPNKMVDICPSGTEPQLSNQQRNRATNLSTWTTTVNAGEYVSARVMNVDTATQAVLYIGYTKT